MPTIELEHVTRRWGGFYGVDDLSMTIEDNAFVTLLGPSGCGKTTTLRMIAGLETPTSGRISIGDQVVFDSARGINVAANRRRVGFLFQNYALWPNMTVYKNIAFGLANINEEMPVVDDRAAKAAAMVRALGRPADLCSLILEHRGRKGAVDPGRAALRLVDALEISMSSAKELVGAGIHTASDPKEAAQRASARYQAVLDEARARHQREGDTLNERFELVRPDGSTRTVRRKLSAEEIDLRVRRVGRIVKVAQFMDRYPSELSGGQQQRVAIARTLAPEPSVLFMDEPLSNLDAKLRLEMRSELQRLHIDTGSTFVYVTHDQQEAMTLATRICLMDNGVLQQYQPPMEVYQKPANLFVADFVGNPTINFVDAKMVDAAAGKLELRILGDRRVTFTPADPVDVGAWLAEETRRREAEAEEPQEERARRGQVEKENTESGFRYRVARVDSIDEDEERSEWTDEDFVLGVRPESVGIHPDGMLEAEVYSSMPTGMETTVRLRVGNFLLTGISFGDTVYEIGQKVRVDLAGDALILFARGSGRMVTRGSLVAA